MFLINEELDEDSVKHVNDAEGPAVSIQDGSFAWELNPEKPVVDELVLLLLLIFIVILIFIVVINIHCCIYIHC